MIDRQLIGSTRFPNVRHEDYVFWYYMVVKGVDIHLIDFSQSLVEYRLQTISVSSNKVRQAYGHWRNLRRDFKLTISKSLYCFLYYAVMSVKKYQKN